MHELLKMLTPGQVVAAIYNACTPVGMGILAYTPANMTEGQANELIEAQCHNNVLHLDYVKGRMIKVELKLTPDCSRVLSIDDRFHNRDYYPGHIEDVLLEAATRPENG